jgi:hypothetical protein
MSDDFRELSVVNGHRIRAELVRGAVTGLIIGVVLGALGPFGTFNNIPTLERYAFWIACILGGWLIQAPLYWIGDWIGRERHVPAWIWLPLAAVIAAAPITVLVNGVAVTLLRVTTTDSFFSLYPLVLCIGIPINILSHIMVGMRAHKEAVAHPPAAPKPGAPGTLAAPPKAPAPVTAATGAQTAFFERLPKRLGRELICLRMEDHYLRVYTSAGDALILMKIGDAEQELAGLEGMRVHRSWWVAREAVTGWSRDGKTLTLTLRNGLSAPVARERQISLKQAGWVS